MQFLSNTFIALIVVSIFAQPFNSFDHQYSFDWALSNCAKELTDSRHKLVKLIVAASNYLTYCTLLGICAP
jgi:hypothetical protein